MTTNSSSQAELSPSVIDFHAVRVAGYIERAIDGFLSDPPDSEHQTGYLSCLLTVYREGLGRGASMSNARIEAAERAIKRFTSPRTSASSLS